MHKCRASTRQPRGQPVARGKFAFRCLHRPRCPESRSTVSIFLHSYSGRGRSCHNSPRHLNRRLAIRAGGCGMSAPTLQEMVHRIGETQPRLPFGSALGIGLAALLAVNFPGTWTFIRYFTTMAHEGSHVVIDSLVGFKITGVTLNMKDAKGGTGVAGAGSSVPSLLIGYVGPSAFGLL